MPVGAGPGSVEQSARERGGASRRALSIRRQRRSIGRGLLRGAIEQGQVVDISAAHDPAGGARERYLAFELARALLDDVAARWPLLLVLDDIHWAEPALLDLIEYAVAFARARLSEQTRRA